MKFQIYPSNPKPILLQPFDKMAADESTGPANQRTFGHSMSSPSPRRISATGRNGVYLPRLFGMINGLSLGGAVGADLLTNSQQVGLARQSQITCKKILTGAYGLSFAMG